MRMRWLALPVRFLLVGATQQVLAAWIAFEGWASAFLGLDESKYEWAKYEQQIDMEEELENIATNNMPSQKVQKCLGLVPRCRHTAINLMSMQVIQSMEEGQVQPGAMEMCRTRQDDGSRQH